MYGKIFESIYDGTLADHWQALITFQQMIVLCDSDGTIDMTPSAISRRTGIPIEHIEDGIKVLEQEDPCSRTPDEDGRRIVKIDEHRPWGWYIVNHRKYKKLKDADEVREQNRLRKRKQREREKESGSHVVTQGHAPSRHTDTDTHSYSDTDKKEHGPSGQPPVVSPESKHFEKKVGAWFQSIKDQCESIYLLSAQTKKAFNPYQWVQQKTNAGGHPGAIDESLSGIQKMWRDIKNPWAYVEKIFKTVNGNWNEKDAIKIHKQLKGMESGVLKQFTQGMIKEIV